MKKITSFIKHNLESIRLTIPSCYFGIQIGKDDISDVLVLQPVGTPIF
ncbi:hypothetical protein [Echinicola sediminis]